MRIVVLGAAGGVGREVVRLAAEQGHSVAAVARRPVPVPTGGGVEQISADVRDAALMGEVLAGADAVLWCVGVTSTSGGDVGRAALPPLLAAMERSGVRRFVGISGAGVTLPGDRKGAGARFVSALARRLGGDVVADKDGEHAALVASSAEWTQVRPPRLASRPGTGAYRLTDIAPGLRSAPVPKADVALAMLDLAGNRDWLRAAPFLVSAAA